MAKEVTSKIPISCDTSQHVIDAAAANSDMAQLSDGYNSILLWYCRVNSSYHNNNFSMTANSNKVRHNIASDNTNSNEL
jgi:hypothetical protein